MMLFKAMIVATIVFAGGTMVAASQPRGGSPDRLQMIENENNRMKAAKQRADAAKAAQLEAIQNRATKARAAGAVPAGSEDPI